MSEDALPYWMQKADYSSVNFDPVSLDEALDVLHGHDWQQELDDQATLRARGEKAATPGIAFHHDPEQSLHLLHLCPENSETWLVHYVYPETVRRFWFWTAEVNRRRSATSASREVVDQALTNFFADRHFEVLRVLDRKA